MDPSSKKSEMSASPETSPDLERRSSSHGYGSFDETKYSSHGSGRRMRFDEVLKAHLGEFGLFSKLMLALVCFEEVTFSFQVMSAVFIAAIPGFWCDTSDVSQHTNCTRDYVNNLTVPWTKTGDGAIVQDQCQRYDYNFSSLIDTSSQCSLPQNLSESPVIPCSSWTYDHSEIGETIVTQWDAVCSNAWMASTVAAVFLGGRSVGNFIFGWLADRFGRKKVILCAGVANLLAAAASIAAPNYYFFLVMRFLHASLATGKTNCGFVYILEVSGPSWRVFSACVYMMAWAVAFIILAGIAYLERFLSWRYLLITILIPEVFYYPLVYFFLPESPRWLYLKNRKEEADNIVSNIAKINKREIPKDVDIAEQQDTASRSPLDLVRTPRIRLMTIILLYNWAANGFVYYGLSLNTGSLGGNPYLNIVISGSVEIVAYIYLLWVFKKFGRIWPYTLSMIVAGTAQLLIAAVPTDLNWVIVTLAMIGKFFISASFTMAWIYSTEAYPTGIRNLGLTVTAIGARISSPISPYIALLGNEHPVLPYLIFGMLSLTAGLLVLALPETKGVSLPQTIEDGEMLIKNNRVKLAFWRKNKVLQADRSAEAMIKTNEEQKSSV